MLCARCGNRSVWYPDHYCGECRRVLDAAQATMDALSAESGCAAEDAAMLWPRIVHKRAHRR